MLAELVEVVIGVDSPKHTHTAAVVAAATGAVRAEMTVAADLDGYAELVDFADQHPGLRAWSIEGTGGYDAGLARQLAESPELVVELDRPVRPEGWGEVRPDRCRSRGPGRAGSHPAGPATHRTERGALQVLLTSRHAAIEAATAPTGPGRSTTPSTNAGCARRSSG